MAFFFGTNFSPFRTVPTSYVVDIITQGAKSFEKTTMLFPVSIRIVSMKKITKTIRSILITPILCVSMLIPGISPSYAVTFTGASADATLESGISGAPIIDGGGSCTLYPIETYPQCVGGCGPCPASGNYPAVESSWTYTGQGQSGGCREGYRGVPTSEPGAPMTSFRCEKAAQGSSSEVSGVIGGPFNREYNGVDVAADPAAIEAPLSESDYSAKTLELTSFLWGISEVGEKLCKPVGDTHPVSLVTWWKTIKAYVAAEKIRDALLRDRLTLMNESMNNLISRKEENSDLQLKAIEYQIETLNISIDSMTGSSLFGMDSNGSKVRETARIPWREKLLVAAVKSAEDNVRENNDNVKIYNACVQGVDSSISVASSACARTKKVTECSTDEDGNETCVERIVPDPVPGSCEMAQSFLPMLKKGALKDMATLYFIVPIPSKQINERLVRIGDYIDKQVGMYPKSNDPKYDWSSPIERCNNRRLMTTIKNNGIICPANAPDKSYDKAAADALGASNDPIMQLGRYTLGVQMNQVEYEFGKRMYDDFKAKGMSDFEAEAAMNDWVIKTERSKAFVSDGTYDKVADRAYHDQLAKEYNKQVVACSSDTCTGFTGTKQPEPDYKLPPTSSVSESAKSFLSSMGIYEPTLEDATKKFQDQWNLMDLYLGQPIDRNLYFKYAEDLINKILVADKAKVEALLSRRAQLITLYNNTKKLMNGKNNSGGLGNTTPNNPTTQPGLGNVSVGRQTGVSSSQTVTLAGTNTTGAAAGQSATAFKSSSSSSDSQAAFLMNNSSADSGATLSSSSAVGGNSASMSTGGRNSVRSAGGRNYAVSGSARTQLETIKKSATKNKVQYGQMASVAGKNAIKNEDTIVASLSKKMGEGLDKNFLQKHSGSFSKAMNGLYDPDTAKEVLAGIGTGSKTTTKTTSSSSSYNRSGSYSYSSGGAGGSSSSSSNSRSDSNPTDGERRSGANGFHAGKGATEYRKIPKPDLFKKISDRYNSSRGKLGLKEIEAESEQ